jgi:hypothetical protein
MHHRTIRYLGLSLSLGMLGVLGCSSTGTTGGGEDGSGGKHSTAGETSESPTTGGDTGSAGETAEASGGGNAGGRTSAGGKTGRGGAGVAGREAGGEESGGRASGGQGTGGRISGGTTGEGGTSRSGSGSGGRARGGADAAGETGEAGETSSGGSGVGASAGEGAGGQAQGGSGLGGSGVGGGNTGGTATGGDSTGGMGVGGEATSCPAESHLCVPVVPEDWFGPIVYRADDPSFSCADQVDYPSKAFEGGQSASGAMDCPCECDSPSGANCGTQISVKSYGSTGCSGAVTDSYDPTAGLCFSSGKSAKLTLTAPTAVTCANGSYPARPSGGAAWSTAVMACQGAVLGAACSDPEQICAPLPPAGAEQVLCVYQEADAQCPVTYPSRALYYQSFTDTRACPGASCSCTGRGGTCEAALTSYLDSCGTLVGNLSLSSSSSRCIDATTTISGYILNSLSYASTGGTCEGSTGSATGGVPMAGEVTVCCTESL